MARQVAFISDALKWRLLPSLDEFAALDSLIGELAQLHMVTRPQHHQMMRVWDVKGRMKGGGGR